MAFPFSYESEMQTSVSVPIPKMLQKLEHDLLVLRANELTVEDERLYFKGGFFRVVTNWNVLSFIHEGRVTIEKTSSGLKARWVLNFKPYFWAITTTAVLFFGPPLYRATNITLIEKIGVLGLMWAWIFGGNYTMSVIRFRRWLSKEFADFNADTNTNSTEKVLKAFDPTWQPQWLRNIGWRWKFPFMSVLFGCIWLSILHPFDVSRLPEDIFWRRFTGVIMATGFVAAIIIPYFMGLSLERWNDRVTKFKAKQDYR